VTQQAELINKIEKLPPKYFGEVIDFVGYLQQKAQKEKEDEAASYKAMAAGTELEQEARKWCNPLLGLGKAKGATLTLDRFMEMQQEEIIHENENDQRLWGKK
jgi:hypothetical protein